MLVGIVATLAVLALMAWLLILVVRRMRSRLRGSLRYGLANVSRRAGTSIAQVSALGLGLMALLLLTFVRTDLLDRWQLVARGRGARTASSSTCRTTRSPACARSSHEQGIAPADAVPDDPRPPGRA